MRKIIKVILIESSIVENFGQSINRANTSFSDFNKIKTFQEPETGSKFIEKSKQNFKKR